MSRRFVECFVGVGSNLGEREAIVERALDRLEKTPGVVDLVRSPLYISKAWGYTDQPDFVNAVARFNVVLGPLQILLTLQAIERELGRTRTFRWGPREIDLDLLLYGDVQIDRRGLVLPHPSMHERAFVLAPLRDLCPDYRLPNGQSVDVALVQLERQQHVKRLDERPFIPLVR